MLARSFFLIFISKFRETYSIQEVFMMSPFGTSTYAAHGGPRGGQARHLDRRKEISSNFNQ